MPKPSTELAIRKPPGAIKLPDKGLWTDRFEIRSESSDRIYVIARHKESGKYGCSCPGYCIMKYDKKTGRAYRSCKHLTDGCGLTLSQIHGNDLLTDERAGQKKLR